MIKQLILEFKNMNKSVKSLMFIGFKFAFIICLFSILILCLYNTYHISYIAYDAGTILFKNSILFAVCFFISAFVINKII